ncbi:hypothetical protein TNCV_3927231 [Trichonephila clavipes]|nr:hypothetical protein TNCV_3927231 [Trichonephila clavipes]
MAGSMGTTNQHRSKLLQKEPAIVHQNVVFMHDVAPAHFSITMRNHLRAAYPRRWIGRVKPVALPSRFPDFNHSNFFFCGHMK